MPVQYVINHFFILRKICFSYTFHIQNYNNIKSHFSNPPTLAKVSDRKICRVFLLQFFCCFGIIFYTKHKILLILLFNITRISYNFFQSPTFCQNFSHRGEIKFSINDLVLQFFNDNQYLLMNQFHIYSAINY